MAALLGLHTIVSIKNSHKKWHRKCLNTMCMQSDVFSTEHGAERAPQVVCALLHIQKTRKRNILRPTIVVASSSPLLWSLPHFVATLVSALIGCSSFYVSAPRLDVKHPRHPVFTANSQLSIWVGCCWLWVNRNPKTLQPADVHHISPLPRLLEGCILTLPYPSGSSFTPTLSTKADTTMQQGRARDLL